jgi:hypothetical protein
MLPPQKQVSKKAMNWPENNMKGLGNQSEIS